MLERKVHEKEGKKLPYREAVLGEGAKRPLVLFLHGAGERGNDNKAQLVHGVKELVEWCEAAGQECVVVAPQCARNVWWSNLEGNFKNPAEARMRPEPSWTLALALEVVDGLVEKGGIDTDRIYITGLSMGGYGTFDAVCRRPDFFAAAIPVCGGGDCSQAAKIKEVPMWIFHGGNDRVVPPEMSRAMVAALEKAGGKPKYTEYPGVGHNSWSATYADPEVWEWLFGKKR